MKTIKNFTEVAYSDFYEAVLAPYRRKLTEEEKRNYLKLLDNSKFKQLYNNSSCIRIIFNAQCAKIQSESLIAEHC